MLKLEAITQEMRDEAVKILKRQDRRSKKTQAALKVFSNGADITAAFQDDDPWTTCVLAIDGNIVALGASKRCTYAKQLDMPNSETGQQVAFSRAVKAFRRG